MKDSVRPLEVSSGDSSSDKLFMVELLNKSFAATYTLKKPVSCRNLCHFNGHDYEKGIRVVSVVFPFDQVVSARVISARFPG